MSADAAQKDLPGVRGNPQEESPKHNTDNAALEYLDYSPVCATVLLSNIIDLFIYYFCHSGS